ncbi:MAG: HD-GYP domain-containing protein [Pseudobdellovibrionaceae bacterium]
MKAYLGSPFEDFKVLVKVISKDLQSVDFQQIKTIDEFLEMKASKTAKLFFIDGRVGTQTSSEWVQSVKMSLPEVFICVLYGAEAPIDFAILKKNGAERLMHLLYDQEFIYELIVDISMSENTAKELPLSALNSISTTDLENDTEINFDVLVHLPGNKKTILARKKGTTLDERFLEKATKTKQILYVAKKEMKNFFEYARTIQSSRNVTNPFSVTEKFLKTKNTIQEIMSVFLNDQMTDYQSGKEILEKCRMILSEFELLQASDPKESLNKMKTYSGREQTLYHDAICTCCYAAHLGWILQLPPAAIESLALAGLLHNIGLAKLPTPTILKKIDEYTPDELKAYHQYPENSVNLVKLKKVPLNQEVSNAILEHREHADGTGFPKKLMGQDTNNLAKLVRLALRLQELTSLHGKAEDSDQKTMTLDQALEFIKIETMGKKPLHEITTISTLFQKLQI